MKVTAIVICHKNEQYLDRAVASVLTQTRKADHVFIMGTDCRAETNAAFRKWRESGFVTFGLQGEPMTCAQSKRWAYGESKTDCFLTIDADDWLMPHYIETTMAMMEGGDYGAVGSDYWHYTTDGRLMPFGGSGLPANQNGKINTLPCCSIIRRDAYEASGGYRDENWDDWSLWIRMRAAGFNLGRVPLPQFVYYRHPGQRTASDRIEESRAQVAAVLAECSEKANNIRP